MMLSPPGDFGERLEKDGFRWLKLPMKRRSLAPWSEVRVLASVLKVLRTERPTLLHNFTIKPVVYGSIAALIEGIPTVNAVAGLGHVFASNSIQSRLLRPVVSQLLRFALNSRQGRLILQNRDDKSLFVENRLISSDHIRVICGSGVDTQRFKPNNGGTSDRVSVLLATRLLWEKGLQEFVEAASELRSEGLRVRFLVAGDPDPGNPSAVPMETVNQWAKKGIIEYLGHIDDMAALLNEVDMVALPTFYREGTPRILLEAGASGLPMIATDMPGCREAVVDGQNGLLVPARDARALATAIRALVEDPLRRKVMGRVARQKVLAEFDEKIVIEKTIGVYEEVCPLPKHDGI